LSRYIDVPLQKRDIKAASLPLKVLLVISTPTDLGKLDVAGEEKLIREALGKRIEAGEIELDVLESATIGNINQKLREMPYNIFHFIGHGVFENNKGFIVLVDNFGKSRLLDDESFANFFLGDRNIDLVILNSCKGAKVSSNQAFAGTAPNLVRRAEKRNLVLSKANRKAKQRIRNGSVVLGLALLGTIVSVTIASKEVLEAQNKLEKVYIYLVRPQN